MLTLTWCRLLVLYDTAAPDITGQALHIHINELELFIIADEMTGFFLFFFYRNT
jgi:hypothetical protein